VEIDTSDDATLGEAEGVMRLDAPEGKTVLFPK